MPHTFSHSHFPKKFQQEPAWQACGGRYQLDCPAILKPWLVDPRSLTQALIQQSHGQFKVLVIRQQLQKPLPSEASILSVKRQRLVLLREVVLCGNNTPWVFARTVIPLSTLSGRLKSLQRLENKPLGAMLFADPSMERGDMQVCKLSSQHALLPANLRQASATIWGRRSVFYLDQKPLLVNEFFLPAFNQHLTSQRNRTQQ